MVGETGCLSFESVFLQRGSRDNKVSEMTQHGTLSLSPFIFSFPSCYFSVSFSPFPPSFPFYLAFFFYLSENHSF